MHRNQPHSLRCLQGPLSPLSGIKEFRVEVSCSFALDIRKQRLGVQCYHNGVVCYRWMEAYNTNVFVHGWRLFLRNKPCMKVFYSLKKEHRVAARNGQFGVFCALPSIRLFNQIRVWPLRDVCIILVLPCEFPPTNIHI